MKRTAATLDWLLAADPALRWQTLRDLTGATPAEVDAERARVATEGLGAELLALQSEDGTWGGAAWNRGWTSTMHALLLLRELGLHPASPEAQRALARVLEALLEHELHRGSHPDLTAPRAGARVPAAATLVPPIVHG